MISAVISSLVISLIAVLSCREVKFARSRASRRILQALPGEFPGTGADDIQRLHLVPVLPEETGKSPHGVVNLKMALADGRTKTGGTALRSSVS